MNFIEIVSHFIAQVLEAVLVLILVTSLVSGIMLSFILHALHYSLTMFVSEVKNLNPFRYIN